jgi:uncharacterized membrane protein YphA (DoxX/SURF4 family)
MFELTSANIVAGLIGLFFVVGGIGNWIAPPRVVADYERWGYPRYFHYLTAVLELAAGALILNPGTRPFGAVLGALVMAAAVATLFRHKEFKHAIPAILALAGCVIIFALLDPMPFS